jgi:hypothetical protein
VEHQAGLRTADGVRSSGLNRRITQKRR